MLLKTKGKEPDPFNREVAQEDLKSRDFTETDHFLAEYVIT